MPTFNHRKWPSAALAGMLVISGTLSYPLSPTVHANDTTTETNTSVQTEVEQSPFQHTPPTTILANEETTISASISSEQLENIVLLYKTATNTINQKMMEDQGNGTYKTTFTPEELQDIDTLFYSIEAMSSESAYRFPTAADSWHEVPVTPANNEEESSAPPVEEDTAEQPKPDTDNSTPVEDALNEDEADLESQPPFYITELLPNSENVNGSDGYEFIEIANNQSESVDFSGFTLHYNYPEDKPSQNWSLTQNAMIAPGETIVIWIKNSGNQDLTNADFNGHYGTDLSDAQLFQIEADGMANAAERELSIENAAGDVLVSASYIDGDADEAGKSIVYHYPNSGTVMTKVGPGDSTPGVLQNNQVPSTRVAPIDNENASMTIEHNAPSSLAYDQATLEAMVQGADRVQIVVTTEHSTHTMAMENTDGANHYGATLPMEWLWTGKLSYKIQAIKRNTTESTEDFSVDVSLPDVDVQSLSPFLITEVVPDSANVSGADGYEYIEVYNTTDTDLPFTNYRLQYRYPNNGPASDLMWDAEEENIIIPSGEAVVFWIKNGHNQETTADEFNSNYGSSLTLGENLFTIESGGMANSGARGLVVATKSGLELNQAFYNDTDHDDTAANKGILFMYPFGDSIQQQKMSAGEEDASPGEVLPGQVPGTNKTWLQDNEEPTIQDQTSQETLTEPADLIIKATVEDNQMVEKVTLVYSTSGPEDVQSITLRHSGEPNIYTHTIPAAVMIGAEKFTYSIEATDGTNTFRTNEKTISVEGTTPTQDVRLNLENNAFVRGETLIKGAANGASANDVTLAIDGTPITTETFAALEKEAYLSFDIKNTNMYFKNAVTFDNKDILYTFSDSVNAYENLLVPIDPSLFQSGMNDKLSIKAGNKETPFEDVVEENRDDFLVRNIRLILSSGETFRDPTYGEPQEDISVGDGATAIQSVDLSFDIPSEHFAAKAYKWDTANVADGEHKITVSHGTNASEVTVIVDNTAPSITPTLGTEAYKGSFVIDATIEDSGSQVAEKTVTLDGETINLPYDTSSAVLTPGEHTLAITATDHAGNTAEKTTTFTTVAEHPDQPLSFSPEDGATNVQPGTPLNITVTDPTGDELDVQFFEGRTHDAFSDTIQFSKGATATEPPTTMTPSEQEAMSSDDIALLSEVDGKMLVSDTTGTFPYHRFDITLEKPLAQTDTVEAVWDGATLKGRKVTMYAWNPSTERWIHLKEHVADSTKLFQLKAEVGREFVANNTIQLMVQDEIPTPADYDYTFVWMSDTQYYSESYPYIYESQVEWIRDNKEAMDIRYVFHTGDIVDEVDQPYQWDVADKSMSVLEEADIPYGVLAGNHDVGQRNNDYTIYSSYFGKDRFEDQHTYGGSYKDNRGHYDLISAEGNDFIMMYMGWGVDEEGMDWMNEVLARYPNRTAILNFHEYLLVSGNRSGIGDDIFEAVVKPNPNVVAVLSGHYHDSETLVDAIDDDGDGEPDRRVYQMLADYQGGPEGGQGYMRLLHIDKETNQIYVNTYSPYMDDYNFYDTDEHGTKDEFKIEMDLQPQDKRVATDSFAVNIYSTEAIDDVQEVASGTSAEAAWDTKAGTTYSWYATLQDDFGGSTRSELMTFTTAGTGTPPEDDDEDDQGDDEDNQQDNENDENDDDKDEDKQDNDDENQESGSSNDSEDEQNEGSWVGDELHLNVNADGTLELPSDAFAEANEAVTIVLSAQADGEQRVDIDQEALQDLQNLPSSTWTTGSVQLTIPQEAWGNAEGAATLVIQTENAAGTAIVEPIGSAVTVGLEIDGEPNAWNAPVTLELSHSLTPQQQKLAGVYRMSGTEQTYLNGKINDQPATATVDQDGTYGLALYHAPFEDITSHWSRDAVRHVAAKHIAKGIQANAFVPENNLTRADMALFIGRMLDVNSDTDTSISFADVPNDHYAAGAIQAMANASIVEGYNGQFRPDDVITREEAVVMIVRALELQGDTWDAGPPASFTDSASVSGWAKDAVTQASSLRLIQGKGAGSFAPGATLTRAEMATMLSTWLSNQ
ncbi:S-layer homology domain-containing protein [Aureibacillus halotolerans]|uniref:S-layer family protein n=1 Tax=Aureibacillus halotolerans TaxID=1508390 RepID=A0A4R6U5I4_9BACI|nr:S-layer homology domain-containing protein [Aureibacillus halotolerans]TDQ38294.1 S-layer family protein [Aureibacillus halotolerans]